MSKPKDKEKEAGAAPADNPDVVIVRAATAPKISPRGEGGVAYQVGRVGAEVHIRIEKNDGGGRHSREWVPAASIAKALTPAMRRGEPFKSDALAGAFVGRSQCNSGFLVAALRAEGILGADAEKRGMSRLSGDLDAWEKSMQEAAPLFGDDGQPLTAKLHPEPKQTGFRRKADAEPTPPEDTKETSPADGDAEPQGAPQTSSIGWPMCPPSPSGWRTPPTRAQGLRTRRASPTLPPTAAVWKLCLPGQDIGISSTRSRSYCLCPVVLMPCPIPDSEFSVTACGSTTQQVLVNRPRSIFT